ncbi:MAG: chemotaxis response regulator protein-glutamate methylesterase [Chthonomonadales bacterium]|nr:chemotaxis response regulator protein-glutamate methylesterase [Chthonomonadales bacterium]
MPEEARARAPFAGLGVEPRSVRALVVDDSAFMRHMVADILRGGGVEVVGAAAGGVEGLGLVARLKPDVITLDIEMPEMDGITFLSGLASVRPTPVVVLSSLAEAGAVATVRCLELGAVDCLHKPSGAISLGIDRIGGELVASVMAAAQARPTFPARSSPVALRSPAASGHGAQPAPLRPDDAVVVLASSTGGPAALTAVVPRLPADLPAALVIVQHLPVGFTRALARRLDSCSALAVREAETGMALQRGLALVAPAGSHLEMGRSGRVVLSADPPIWGVRPAADVTLRSAAQRFGARVVAVVMTGMGRDGALGARAVRQRGGLCVAQSEETCAIYGMPRAAWEAGAVERLIPLDAIAEQVAAAVTSGAAARGGGNGRPVFA